MIVRSLVLGLAVGAIAAGCGYLPFLPTPAPPIGVQVTTPQERLRLNVANGTTIPTVLTVNGEAGRPIAPGQGADLGLADLGPLPWSAQVRTVSGRALVELTVRAGDVWTLDNGDGSGGARGDGARVDLSCGRIDMWSGPPMVGPAPGLGLPGDCDP